LWSTVLALPAPIAEADACVTRLTVVPRLSALSHTRLLTARLSSSPSALAALDASLNAASRRTHAYVL